MIIVVCMYRVSHPFEIVVLSPELVQGYFANVYRRDCMQESNPIQT